MIDEDRKSRVPYALQILGVFLLLVFAAIPVSIKLVHNFGYLEGWEGFGLFVIGLRLLPWMASLGTLLFVLGTALRGRESR